MIAYSEVMKEDEYCWLQCNVMYFMSLGNSILFSAAAQIKFISLHFKMSWGRSWCSVRTLSSFAWTVRASCTCFASTSLLQTCAFLPPHIEVKLRSSLTFPQPVLSSFVTVVHCSFPIHKWIPDCWRKLYSCAPSEVIGWRWNPGGCFCVPYVRSIPCHDHLDWTS